MKRTKTKSGKQTGLLSMLSKTTQAAGSSVSSPVVSKDLDPYEFLGSQSLQPNTQPTGKLPCLTNDQCSIETPTRTRRERDRTQTPRLKRASGQHTPGSSSRVSPKTTPKSKKSPGLFSEAERLRQQEDDDLKKALEASRRENEREARKRKREERRETEEQNSILKKLQEKKEKLNQTIESIEKAQCLTTLDLLEEKSDSDSTEPPEARETAIDIDSETDQTQPLSANSSTLAVKQTGTTIPDSASCLTIKHTAIPASKSVKVTVEKLNVSFTRKKNAPQSVNQATKLLVDQNKVPVDNIESTFSMTTMRDDDIQRSGHSESDETPPLSRESSVVCSSANDADDVSRSDSTSTKSPHSNTSTEMRIDETASQRTLTPALSPKKSFSSTVTPKKSLSLTVSAKKRSAQTVDTSPPVPSLTPDRRYLRQSRQDLDLISVGALTTSSNFENSSSSEYHSLPFKTTSNTVIPTVGSQSPKLTQKTSSVSTNTDSCVTRVEVENNGARNRSGMLSLKRKNRKRTSAEIANSTVVFEEVANKSPSKSPLAKKQKLTEESENDATNTVRVNADGAVATENSSKITDNTDRSISAITANGTTDIDSAVNVEHLRSEENSPVEMETTRTPCKANDKTINYQQKQCLGTRKRVSHSPTQPSPKRLKLHCPAKTSGKSVTLSKKMVSLDARKVSSCTILHKINPLLPPMYCPKDSCPSDYTPLIIQRFNSYFSQLRLAQSKVLTRLKWGEPVKVASSKKLSLTLDISRKTRRLRNADKLPQDCFLILPKRKTHKEQNAGKSLADGGMPRERTFSLSEDSDEQMDDLVDERSRTQPSPLGQRSNVSPSRLTDEAPKIDSDFSDTKREYNSGVEGGIKTSLEDKSSDNGPTRPRNAITAEPLSKNTPSDYGHLDDFILLDTQEESHSNRLTSQGSPPLSGYNSEEENNPRDHSQSLSKSESEVDSEDSSNWLSSRQPSHKTSMSQKNVRNASRTVSVSPKKKRIQGTTKKVKSAAAKMMLEVHQDSGSDSEISEDGVKSNTPIRVKRKTSLPHSNSDSAASNHGDTSRNTSNMKRKYKKFLSDSSCSDDDDKVDRYESSVTSELRPSQSKSVIDLTEDSQAAPSHTLTSLTRPPLHNQDLSTCPICQKRYPKTVIEVHAAQCDGDDAYSQNYRYYRTKQSISGHRTKMYQPTLRQLEDKEKEVARVGGNDIDSDSTVDFEESRFQLREKEINRNDENQGNPLLDEMYTALDSEDSQLETPLDLDCEQASGGHVTETRLIPDTDGGFIVDESTISNSPIKTFTKISDLGPKDQERLRSQFKGHTSRRALSRSNAGTSASTWGREDFSELARGGRSRTRGRSRGGGRGRSRGKRGNKNFKRSRGRPRN